MGELLEKYRGFIIDLDGVVYLLHQTIEGSPEVINRLQREGVPFVFLTNNSVATPEMYVERLLQHGIDVSPEAFVTSPQAVGRYLDEKGVGPGSTAFVIGERGLVRELEDRGVRLLDTGEGVGADYVFVGWDRDFCFEKLKTAVVAVRRGAGFVATNADATYPTPEGLWPGSGSILAAVRTGAAREPVVAGKPNPLIVELALQRLGLEAGEVLLVGDRLDTDILAGANAGVDTLLVLTGVSQAREAEEAGIIPTYVRRSLSDLLA